MVLLIPGQFFGVLLEDCSFWSCCSLLVPVASLCVCVALGVSAALTTQAGLWQSQLELSPAPAAAPWAAGAPRAARSRIPALAPLLSPSVPFPDGFSSFQKNCAGNLWQPKDQAQPSSHLSCCALLTCAGLSAVLSHVVTETSTDLQWAGVQIGFKNFSALPCPLTEESWE